MDQSQITPPDSHVEEQSRPPEEVIQELVQDIESLLESGQPAEALNRFAQLHPVDQGEVLEGLPREISQSLLADLDHWVVAEILESSATGLSRVLGQSTHRLPAGLIRYRDPSAQAQQQRYYDHGYERGVPTPSASEESTGSLKSQPGTA